MIEFLTFIFVVLLHDIDRIGKIYFVAQYNEIYLLLKQVRGWEINPAFLPPALRLGNVPQRQQVHTHAHTYTYTHTDAHTYTTHQ